MNKCDLDVIHSCAPEPPPGFSGPHFRCDAGGAHADYVGRPRSYCTGRAFVGSVGEAYRIAREALGGPFYWEAELSHRRLPGGGHLLTWSMRRTEWLLPQGGTE